MKEWKEYILGDIVEKVIDNRGKSAPSSNNERYPLIEINALGGYHPNYNEIRKYVSDTVFHSWFRAGHPTKGDILIPTVGTIGIVSLMDNCDACIAQNVIALRLKKEFCPEFVYYYLKCTSAVNYLLNLNIGGVQPSIKVPHLLRMPIFLPDLETQKKIANILLSFDNRIELNNRINHNLEEQAQALFKSWFVDFEPFQNGDFINTELGMIPEGWSVGTLNELCVIVGGGTPSKSRSDYFCKEGIPWLTPKDLSVSKAKFTAKGELDITELGYKNSGAKLMPKGSVLYSSRAPIGYISIAKNDICTNQGFKSAVPGKAGTAFLYYYLKTNTERIISKSTGSTFKEASGSLMKSLSTVIPPKDVLSSFEELEQPVFKEQEILEAESRQLAIIRDIILPKLLSGEIAV